MEKIAIIGLSCLFPEATTPNQYWHNLVANQDSTSQATVEQMGGEAQFAYALEEGKRLDPQIAYELEHGKSDDLLFAYDPEKGKIGKTYCLRGGWIHGFEFDATGYALPAEFLARLDNLFKWSLYISKQALEDCDYVNNATVLAKTGVILGNLVQPTRFSNLAVAPLYQPVVEQALQDLLSQPHFTLPALPGGVSPYNLFTAGYPAAVIAQALSLGGINFALDGACASTLYVVHLACHYLLTGQADLMLAGAICRPDPMVISVGFSALQAYPENERTLPLDQTSQGLLSGEGGGMFVLKRYRDALRDGDRIYATIRGIGLSNDGGGKHILVPNPKGQLLAFERAYTNAGLHPEATDYVECHATGTPVGDQIELNSMDTFFGQYQARPLIGAAKANVGHLLTAGGVTGMLKVILAMNYGIIPATIHLQSPLVSENKRFTGEQMVTANRPWPGENTVRRAAVSAFGFGGCNGHIILEHDLGHAATTPQTTPEASPAAAADTRMAIIGMGAHFGNCPDLATLGHTIYAGDQHFSPLPPQRWKGIEEQAELLETYGFEKGKAPEGAYIDNFAMEFTYFKILPNDYPIPQQLLILKVADSAIKDAGLSRSSTTAVIIAMETEPNAHRLRQRGNVILQIKGSVFEGTLSLPPEKIAELETLTEDGFHPLGGVNEHASFVGSLMASRISSLWDFNGPSFIMSSEENSVFKALDIAKLLLASGEVEAVVVGAVDLAGGLEYVCTRNQLANVNTGTKTLSFDQKANGWLIGEGAGAVVLKRYEDAKQDGDRIYATIDAIGLQQDVDPDPIHQVPKAESVARACQQAFSAAGVTPEEIGYMEVFASGVAEQDEAEIQGLLAAYHTDQETLSCAIGSVKANIGHTYAASGMASLIKTALCLYHRYIPATPNWSEPKQPDQWQGSPFYVATQSTPWFVKGAEAKRIAAINGLGLDRTYAHLIVSEEPGQQDRRNGYLSQTPPYLFLLAGDNEAALLEQLEVLQQELESCASLAAAARDRYHMVREQFQPPQRPYILALLGGSKAHLHQEIAKASPGVSEAFATGQPWKTPRGSYFTSEPLGDQGTVAFVYPGAFNAHLGLARELFHLFPQFSDADSRLSSTIPETLVYPRSLKKLSPRELEHLEEAFLSDTLAMYEVGLLSAVIGTYILQTNSITSQAAIGYSLGISSMLFALGVYSDIKNILDFPDSSLFKTQLRGPKNAVRTYWGLPEAQEQTYEEIWEDYVLLASPAQVRAAIQEEERVYLTLINSPREVVIAGDPQSCERVINAIGCQYFRAPINNVLHCPPVKTEYETLFNLSNTPVRDVPGLKFYVDADEPLASLSSSDQVAHRIVNSLCNQVDFPQIIQRAYADGSRIFIEIGPGNTCTRWIRESLKQQAHVAVALNTRGVPDKISILKAAAQLICHRVPGDIAPLYDDIPEHSTKTGLVKTISLGGEPIIPTIASEANKARFMHLSNSAPEPYLSPTPEPAQALPAQPAEPVPVATQPVAAATFHAQPPPKRTGISRPGLRPEVVESLLDVYDRQTQTLHQNTSAAITQHRAFLRARREALQQRTNMIELQMSLSNRLLGGQAPLPPSHQGVEPVEPMPARRPHQPQREIAPSPANKPQQTWQDPAEVIAFDPAGIKEKLLHLHQPCYLVRYQGRLGATHEEGVAAPSNGTSGEIETLAVVSPLQPHQLGDPGFRTAHGVQYAYASGSMANGIASEDVVMAMGQAQMLASFGAAGLLPDRIEAAIHRIQGALPHGPYAFNLIYSPHEPALEQHAVALYLKYGVTTVEASAFMVLTPYIVHYRVAGLSLNAAGQIEVKHRVIAKLSSHEVASQFMQPAPAKILDYLVQQGLISAAQARLAEKIPMADDVTVEADSGGHTDNRPLVSLLPSMLALRDKIQATYHYQTPSRIGAAGGISTPSSALGAFMMGAAYVVTGSINQSCIEAGTSPHVKTLLAQAGLADMAMAPAADMFEMGVKVQLLKKGTLFPMRAQKLYDLYTRYNAIEEIPAEDRQTLEAQIFKRDFETVWQDCVAFFSQRDPDQLTRVANNPKRKMALIFRWYLGLSSTWANRGETGREADYQIWCGPAMGAFNDWVQDSYLADPANRRVVDIAHHIMIGAAYLYRVQQLKSQGVHIAGHYSQYCPFPLSTHNA